ncbi:hypothetical protein ACFFGV_05540 [Pontibacillus salicampi]|uniref:YesK-like protein n=1 Tax=Pontibacillus salicampi TaxID=1449801 RepID=A0ABV6LL40_9BACI
MIVVQIVIFSLLLSIFLLIHKRCKDSIYPIGLIVIILGIGTLVYCGIREGFEPLLVLLLVTFVTALAGVTSTFLRRIKR